MKEDEGDFFGLVGRLEAVGGGVRILFFVCLFGKV
jgi:hypothetical protein